MNDWHNYGKRGYYPHMKPADVAIWERFMEKYPDAYDQCQYDLGVGEGPEFSTLLDEETGADASELYKYKIDVVGKKGDRIDIIELKPDAAFGAFGQVMSYQLLYEALVDPQAETRAVIITNRLRPEMARLSKEHEVVIIVV